MPGAISRAEAFRLILVRSPVAPLLLAELVLLVVVAGKGGGFDGGVWYPAALLTGGLLLIALVALPLAVPRIVLTAAALLVTYALWSYLSITWADQKGDAWDGANRTLLYALVFALLALWRVRAAVAAGLLGVFAVGIATLAVVELARASGSAAPAEWFIGRRFSSPATYQNANVALWTMALWPSLILASRRESPAVARGVLAAAAVVLLAAALLGQSRGWLFAAPVTVILLFAVTPQRVRLALTSLAIAASVALIHRPLLDVYSASGDAAFSDAVVDATRTIVLAAAVTGVLVGAAAAVERSLPLPRPEVSRWAGRALLAAAALAAVVGTVALVGKVGGPVAAARDGWETFKTEPSPTGEGSRFSQSLGSLRYDFWRVAWNEFERRPLTGIGADNFQQPYLAQRRGYQEPRYPHSVQLRVLSQTGLVGALLLGGAVGSALLAAALAIRRRRGIGAASAAAGAVVFGSWLVHGSIDWFWEYPALGASAFAALGLAAGLMPRHPGRGRPLASGMVLPAALVAALASAAALTLPWIAERYTDAAVASWHVDPDAAFARLQRAADANPLSALPYLYAGSIAIKLDRHEAAESYFHRALAREPRSQFAELELGLLAARADRRRDALRHLRRAAALNPRDEITADALARVRRGRPVSIDEVNSAIARESEEAIQ